MATARNYTTISKNWFTIATNYVYLQQCFNECLNYYDACIKERIECKLHCNYVDNPKKFIREV